MVLIPSACIHSSSLLAVYQGNQQTDRLLQIKSLVFREVLRAHAQDARVGGGSLSRPPPDPLSQIGSTLVCRLRQWMPRSRFRVQCTSSSVRLGFIQSCSKSPSMRLSTQRGRRRRKSRRVLQRNLGGKVSFVARPQFRVRGSMGVRGVNALSL